MAEFGVPAVPLKCHRNVRVERSHHVVWNIVGFMQSSTNLWQPARGGRELWKTEMRGPLAAVSHTYTLDRAHQRPQLTKTKRRDETRITSRSCLWMAARILHIWWPRQRLSDNCVNDKGWILAAHFQSSPTRNHNTLDPSNNISTLFFLISTFGQWPVSWHSLLLHIHGKITAAYSEQNLYQSELNHITPWKIQHGGYSNVCTPPQPAPRHWSNWNHVKCITS